MNPRFPTATDMWTGYLSVLGAIVLWGLNFVVASFLAGSVPPAALTFWRWFGAFALLSFMLPKLWRTRAQLRAHWRFYTLCSLTGVGLFHYCIYRSAQTSETYGMPLIAASSGVFVLLASPFLGRRVSLPNVVGALLAVTGLAVLISRGDPRFLLLGNIISGDLWMLLGAAVWAAYSLMLERSPPGSRLEVHSATILFAIVPLGVLYGAEFAATGPFEASWTIIACIAYLALFPSVVCYWLWLGAIGKIGAERAHSLYYGIPLITAAEALLILGEPLDGYHFAAALLIITGALLAARN